MMLILLGRILYCLFFYDSVGTRFDNLPFSKQSFYEVVITAGFIALLLGINAGWKAWRIHKAGIVINLSDVTLDTDKCLAQD
jgi:hypothetical protein